jgi:hypothetical protein
MCFVYAAEETKLYGNDYCGPRGVAPYLESGQRRLSQCSYLGNRYTTDTAGFCFGYENGCTPEKRYGYPTYV